MVVDNTAGSEVLEYIGNATTMIPAFFLGASEGSTKITKVSSSYNTDSNARFSLLDHEKRYVHIDISDAIDSSGIKTISECRSPLTSGYSTTNIVTVTDKAEYLLMMLVEQQKLLKNNWRNWRDGIIY